MSFFELLFSGSREPLRQDWLDGVEPQRVNDGFMCQDRVTARLRREAQQKYSGYAGQNLALMQEAVNHVTLAALTRPKYHDSQRWRSKVALAMQE
jgi:hypothetical protein